MAVNLEAADQLIEIISRSASQPVGINQTKPQFVYVGAPIRLWELHNVSGNKYLFRIDGHHYAGVIDGKVAVSGNPSDEVTWEVTHHLFNIGYTITLASDPNIGWTASEDTGEIEIRPIKVEPSFPPKYQPNQLFLLELFTK